MISRDAIRLDSPAAQREMAYLQAVKLGDVRHGVLLPALEVGMEWTCSTITKTRWEFEGRFFGQLVYRMIIRVDAGMLTCDVRPEGS